MNLIVLADDKMNTRTRGGGSGSAAESLSKVAPLEKLLPQLMISFHNSTTRPNTNTNTKLYFDLIGAFMPWMPTSLSHNLCLSILDKCCIRSKNGNEHENETTETNWALSLLPRVLASLARTQSQSDDGPAMSTVLSHSHASLVQLYGKVLELWQSSAAHMIEANVNANDQASSSGSSALLQEIEHCLLQSLEDNTKKHAIRQVLLGNGNITVTVTPDKILHTALGLSSSRRSTLTKKNDKDTTTAGTSSSIGFYVKLLEAFPNLFVEPLLTCLSSPSSFEENNKDHNNSMPWTTRPISERLVVAIYQEGNRDILRTICKKNNQANAFFLQLFKGLIDDKEQGHVRFGLFKAFITVLDVETSCDHDPTTANANNETTVTKQLCISLLKRLISSVPKALDKYRKQRSSANSNSAISMSKTASVVADLLRGVQTIMDICVKRFGGTNVNVMDMDTNNDNDNSVLELDTDTMLVTIAACLKVGIYTSSSQVEEACLNLVQNLVRLVSSSGAGAGDDDDTTTATTATTALKLTSATHEMMVSHSQYASVLCLRTTSSEEGAMISMSVNLVNHLKLQLLELQLLVLAASNYSITADNNTNTMKRLLAGYNAGTTPEDVCIRRLLYLYERTGIRSTEVSVVFHRLYTVQYDVVVFICCALFADTIYNFALSVFLFFIINRWRTICCIKMNGSGGRFM
jgi:hypothetical protein